MALLARESVFLLLLAKEEKHQSEVRKTGVLLMQLKKMHDPALFGGGSAACSMRANSVLSMLFCAAPTHSEKKRATGGASTLVLGARLIPVKYFVVALLGLRGAGPLVQQVPSRTAWLNNR